MAPPVAGKFNNLKQVVLARYGLSDEQKVEKISSGHVSFHERSTGYSPFQTSVALHFPNGVLKESMWYLQVLLPLMK